MIPWNRALAILIVLVAPATGGASSPRGASEPASAPEGGTCGSGGAADCPMQGWMKAQLQPGLASRDFARLQKSLDRLAAMAPSGFDGWAETAKSGARAAGDKDAAGVAASCKQCHDAHRARYRAERRDKPL